MMATSRSLELSLLPGRYAISRLPADAPLPSWATEGLFCSVTRTGDEVSVVSEESRVPYGVLSQPGWCALRIRGNLPLSEVGVLAALAEPLACARISLFVISTYDTDYLLLASENLAAAISALEQAGHSIDGSISER
jgi:uncharacterized protein